MTRLTSIELCAGAGGQALGLERAGFEHLALVEIDPWACRTLRHNRPNWTVIEGDLREFDPTGFAEVDLVAGGVPCPPFSKAGLQLGADDERDLFPEALRIVSQLRPRAVMLENVRGILDPVFSGYREEILQRLAADGYWAEWKLLHASDFGVPQLRPRAILVAVRTDVAPFFSWPEPTPAEPITVGSALRAQMASGGWLGADDWADAANKIAPTLVGGSKKHGGPDLGPTRAKRAWLELGVDGHGLADAPPAPDFEGMPRLTALMTATLQGFPDSWEILGKKTNAYRQVGNAFPPPVAHALGAAIAEALVAADQAAAAVPKSGVASRTAAA